MAKQNISIDREIAQKIFDYARTIKGRIETADENRLLTTESDNALDSIYRAKDEAEQIEWYLGGILQPEQYKRVG